MMEPVPRRWGAWRIWAIIVAILLGIALLVLAFPAVSDMAAVLAFVSATVLGILSIKEGDVPPPLPLTRPRAWWARRSRSDRRLIRIIGAVLAMPLVIFVIVRLSVGQSEVSRATPSQLKIASNAEAIIGFGTVPIQYTELRFRPHLTPTSRRGDCVFDAGITATSVLARNGRGPRSDSVMNDGELRVDIPESLGVQLQVAVLVATAPRCNMNLEVRDASFHE